MLSERGQDRKRVPFPLVGARSSAGQLTCTCISCFSQQLSGNGFPLPRITPECCS
uniref:Uncharacterized protein n=1 Tax=Anguilla anguilla TaxID=7936 RepID=A0A0E9PPU1_ANGAN